MTKLDDLTGRTFGLLRVVGKNAPRPAGRTEWLCLCECGQTKIAIGQYLKSGVTTSCGCTTSAKRSKSFTTHGMAHTPTWCCWVGLRARCNNPNNGSYSRYGGRGIKVCERWERSFEDFYADMGPRPSSAHSIDRIDNDKGYEPGNCRWATPRVQNSNTRRNVILEHNGESLTLAEWAVRTGINIGRLSWRIKTGWTAAQALTTPQEKAGNRARRADGTFKSHSAA
jgi:hypothetical protein